MNTARKLSTYYQAPELSVSYSFNKTVEALANEFDNIPYKKGQIIFNVGTTPRGLYHVESGKIKIHKYGSDGKEQILKIATTGDFLGYKDLLNSTRYSATTSAVDDSVITFIPREDFFAMMDDDFEVSSHFTHLLCQDLIDTEEKMISLAYKPVRGRLAETLLDLNKIYATEETEKKSMINLSREDMSHLIGTAKETVIRLLSEFKSENLIKIEGKFISIVDPNGLIRVLNLYR